MILAILLFILAGLTTIGTLAIITVAKNAGPTIRVTIVNLFWIVVEILAAFRLLKG